MSSKFHRRNLIQLSAAAVAYLSSLRHSLKAASPGVSEQGLIHHHDNLSCVRSSLAGVGFALGRYPMVQAASSADTVYINALVPRLRAFKYEVTAANNFQLIVEPYEVATHPMMHWKMDKLKIEGLSPNVSYTLKPFLEEKDGKKSYADERVFKTLDESRSDLKILFGSCLSEEDYFEDVMAPMWTKAVNSKPDLMLLIGDLVYVDSFNFVEREKATEVDIWMRYIEAMRTIPLYRTKELIPVFAGWDDHDAGTNNSHRESVNIQYAKKMFQTFFFGQSIPGVYERGEDGIYWSHQNKTLEMILLDDRSFKQPPKQFEAAAEMEEEYSLLGNTQHEWFCAQMNLSEKPVFLMCGTQFINGAEAKFIESFQQNKKNFARLVEAIRKSKRVVLFGSGDLHISEIQYFGTGMFGFPHYELTSSSIHSFTSSKIWENKKRVVGTNEYNFILLDLIDWKQERLNLNVTCQSLKEKPVFERKLQIG